MQGHATDPGEFIRSMASRGSLGGMAASTDDAIKVLDAASYQTVFVETIGVGQTEIKVVKLSDIVLLASLKAAGVQMIDQTPRGGAHGSRIAFLHPKSSGKVLSELTQVGS